MIFKWEENIYQIGTVEESVTGDVLAKIAAEFFAEMEEKYGSHVHILNWALHLDEGTPHIHEWHVFDCENHNLHLQIESTYGGRVYLEKQDFIIEKQKQTA